ncbi:transporter [Trichophyton mentagrophytes]|nr:transporter [Trichophyton mentagrophytes]
MAFLPILTKVDLCVLPLLILSLLLAGLDKNALAFAAVLGMNKDLGLHGQQYSWLGSIFNIAYLFAEFPTSWLLTRLPIGKYVGTSLILWGAAGSAMAACTNFASAAAVRFLLGALESAILPSVIVIMSTWYRREEQPLRAALCFGPFSGIFGGILAYAIGTLRAPIPTWKLIFLIYGAITIAVGFICLVVLPDNHDKAMFLSKGEREQAKLRVADNKTGRDTRKKWKLSQVLEALKDGKYWCVVAFVLFQSVTNAGVTNFNPLIIAGFGYSKQITVLLAAPQGAVALTAQVIAALLALYIPNLRCLLWVLSCIPSLAGTLVVRYVSVSENRIAALMGVYLTGFYNIAWSMALSLVASNTAGATKKSFVSASIAIAHGVGGLVGPQFFLDSQKPQYQLGLGAMIASLIMMAVCGIVYGALCVYQNKARDNLGEFTSPLPAECCSAEEHIDGETDDRTDREMHSFRYTY